MSGVQPLWFFFSLGLDNLFVTKEHPMLNTGREIQELPYKRRSVTFCWGYKWNIFRHGCLPFIKRYAWPLQFSPNIKENVVKQWSRDPSHEQRRLSNIWRSKVLGTWLLALLFITNYPYRNDNSGAFLWQLGFTMFTPLLIKEKFLLGRHYMFGGFSFPLLKVNNRRRNS